MRVSVAFIRDHTAVLVTAHTGMVRLHVFPLLLKSRSKTLRGTMRMLETTGK